MNFCAMRNRLVAIRALTGTVTAIHVRIAIFAVAWTFAYLVSLGLYAGMIFRSLKGLAISILDMRFMGGKCVR